MAGTVQPKVRRETAPPFALDELRAYLERNAASLPAEHAETAASLEKLARDVERPRDAGSGEKGEAATAVLPRRDVFQQAPQGLDQLACLAAPHALIDQLLLGFIGQFGAI